MARPKKITTDKLRQYLTQYISEYPSETVTPSSLAAYIQTCGEDVAAYLIRRDASIMAEIESVNKDIIEKMLPAVAVFQPLDIDAFLAHNTTPKQMRAALTQRDRYYASVVRAAKAGLEMRRTMSKEIENLRANNDNLTAENARLKQKLDKAQKNRADTTALTQQISQLKSIIRHNINPEIANALLARAGLAKMMDDCASAVPEKRLEELSISANTDIQRFSVDALNRMMEEFDDE